MSSISNALLVNMKTIVQVIALAALLSGCRAVVLNKPNNPEVIVIPTSPGPGFIYINDSWKWDRQARSYTASKGYWVQPKKSSPWVDGHWKKTRGGWKYVKGHWK